MTTTSSSNYTGLYGGAGASITPSTPYGNANVVGLLAAGTDGANTVANIVAAGNVSGTYFIGNGSMLTGIAGSYNDANVVSLLESGTLTSNVITTGNVTGGYIFGNGSQLTGLPATYGNAEVVTLLANFGSNTISTTGNITGGNFVGSGAALSSITGANVTGTVANATYALTSGSTSTATTANIALVAYSVAAANISGTVANAAYATDAGHATVADSANAVAGGNVTGNVANAVHAFFADVANSVAGANVTGTVANATYATTAGLASYVTANAQANITSVGTLTNLSVGGNVIASGNISTTGNITGGNLITSGSYVAASLSATGNVTGANIVATTLLTGPQLITTGPSGNISNVNYITAQYFVGNGSLITGITSTATPAGSDTQVQYNNAGSLGADADFTFNSATNTLASPNITASGNVIAAGLITSTANISGANIVASANLTSTQQTIIGTANVGTTGNIVISGKNIATDMAFNPDGGNAITAATARVVVGTGWAGNISHSAQQQRLAVADAFSRTNTATQVRSLVSEQFVTLNGNVTNASFRNQTLGGYLRVGGGSAANTIGLTNAVAAPFSLAAGQFNLDVGNATPYNLGNTTVGHALINGGVIGLAPGSQVTNGFGIYNLVSSPAGSATTGNIVNYIGYSTSMSLTNAPTGNVYMFYNGNSSSASSTNVLVSNTVRQAPEYYAFYNADDHAQVRLGSLKTYHEFRYDPATSGTVNINKNNGQAQYIQPTGDITIGDFQNFVTETFDGSTYDQQVDTVTLIIAQGATPYNITLPTGNAAIKYAGGVSTVAVAANSMATINISAANVASTKTYMVSITNTVASTTTAADAISPLMLMGG